ncbi:MAG: DUF2460 domain-containing protein [Bryobacterales bacterium]|nr:DUF2460 domain-containing protein [Bryobacteraceae bacterium]MDW8356073.1 DUF2460 domain-containing protein [Bryobacterales bacterium]
MASFPTLKTGAPAQYPLVRVSGWKTYVARFVDGSEQRYRDVEQPLKRWVISLELLDDREANELAEFVEAVRGGQSSFSFVDPVDGTVYPDCSLESDEVEFGWDGQDAVRVRLTIRQNKS